MGVSTFNFTGRKDFLRTGGDNPEVEIKIYDTDNGIKFEPIFSTIFEIIIENRLTFTNDALGRSDIFNRGFVKGSQTQDNIIIFAGCIQKQLCFNKNLYLAMVDFKKAFNFVNRSILFYKD